jgi:hypothetical protein
MGSEIIALRMRDLSSNELASVLYMTYIDSYFLYSLTVLDLYYNSNSTYPGFAVYGYNYGSIASTVRVIPPTPSEYLNFTLPTFTSKVESASPSGRLQWDMLDVTTNTVYYLYQENENSTGHVQMDSVNMVGAWELKASSANCRLFRNTGSNNYTVYQIQNSNNALTIVATIDATSALSAVSSTLWVISSDCLRIRTDTNVYAAVSNAGPYTAAGATTGWLAYDASLTYAVTATAILKYSSNAYSSVYTFPGVTFTSASVYAFSGRIVVVSTTASAASTYVHKDNGTITHIWNITASGFDATPAVKVSEERTKVLIYGTKSSLFSSTFYYVDYSTFVASEIVFPTFSIFDPAHTTIMLL